VPAGVHDLGVHALDVLGGGPQLALHLGQLVGQEHIRGLDKSGEYGVSRLGGDVQTDAALVPVEDLEEKVDAVLGRDHSGADHAPAGVAVEALDLDDVGAVLREEGTARRDEPVLGYVDDPDAVQGQAHVRNVVPSRATTVRTRGHIDTTDRRRGAS
jgi:hypothetical protein